MKYSSSEGNSFILLLCSAFCFSLFAARPFVTDDVGIVESGKFEAETACDYWGRNFSAGFCLKHGVTHRMDIGLGLGYTPLPEELRAFHEAEMSMKYALIPDLFAISFAAVWGKQCYAVNFVLTKAIGNVSCDANLGYQTGTDLEGADLTYGLAVVYEFRRVGAGMEIGGSDKALNWWQIGGRLQLVHWLFLDAGVGINFEDQKSYTATTGLLFLFPSARAIIS